jgi:tetratricopeptide (TPR) repeat protein
MRNYPLVPHFNGAAGVKGFLHRFLYRSRVRPLVSDEEANREALEYACAQVEADPDDGIFWILRGHCHYRLGELEEACEAYRHAHDLGEATNHAHFFYGSCLVEAGRFDAAMEPLRLQLMAIPDHRDSLFLLGLLYRMSDMREESDQLLERVRDIDSHFYEHMFAEYAEILAKDHADPLIKQGLIDAARELRRDR